MGIFEIKELSFAYKNSDNLILEDININVEKGEFILICGESGCGKTTLLKHFKKELTPFGYRKGEIVDKGNFVGYVMQDIESQIVTDKVWSELAFGLENMGMDKEQIRLRCAEVSNFFGITSWYHKKTYELSGGQKQLLNLASILALKPEIIVLDEPLSQLDYLAGVEFLNALSRINKELGITILISEHNLDGVMEYADRVIAMENGQIIANEKPEKIMPILRERKSSIISAMPTSMRLYNALNGKGDIPINASQGKIWLERNVEKKYKVDIKEKNEKEVIFSCKELYFGYEREKDVVKNLSLEIYKGEIFSILGSNGSGKTTTLKIFAGILKAYSGKMDKGLKMALLPQNPIELFTERTVLLDLKSTGKDFSNVINLLEIENLLDKNPNDLSGGEIQRCAIAKLIITKPDILLLDEPTKCIDSFRKDKLVDILKGLKISTIIVSHDLDFCAKVSDRCGMFFDGQIINCEERHKFFSDNIFYTTNARKIAENVVENAITFDEIINAIGGSEKIEKKSVKKPIPKDLKEEKIEKTKRSKVGVFLSILAIFFLVPLMIYVGMNFFEDRKYFVVSLGIILVTLTPFFILFESKKARSREIAILSVMCAMAVIGRILFAPFPQIKPVSAIVILSGVAFGGEAGFIVGALSAFCSNFYFGQGPWTPWQMFAFGLIGFISGCFSYFFVGKNKLIKKYRISFFGFFIVLFLYGFIMNTQSAFSYISDVNLGVILASCASGFIFDLTHAISTFIFILAMAEPILERVFRIKEKFGLI